GAELTELGVEVLNAFRRAYQRIHGAPPSPPRAAGRPGERAVLVYAGSNDPLLQRILGLLGDRGVKVEAHWLGSLQGLASVLLGDADVAGVHVVDPVTGEYNKTLLGGVAGAAHLAMVRGYRRRIGLVSRRPVSVEEALQGLLEGRLTVVNRPKGSGSRVLLERLLSEAAGLGWPPDEGLLEARVKGWGRVAATHTEVVEAVARGEADVGVAVEAAASTLGLHFTPLAWEWFDFLLATRRNPAALSQFIEVLCSDEARFIARGLRGYEYSIESCERIL
ncbi:MAG: hypothetical protein GSR80_000309, partial [Desulfurococcales archaeon]|nr:hypothetical protein [Desulfurococcales archaeon]